MLRDWNRRLGRPSLDRVLGVLAIVVGVAVIAWPLAAVRYPPMTDLPFHAAMTAALRHYWDPSFHFVEQFEWRPIAVPYVSLYAVGALLMTALPPAAAVKGAVGLFLALVPAGLSVLFHGLKKSPLLGAFGLLVVWGPLTHWGFINFVGAIGLFAMAVGLALLVAERPTAARRALLSAVLCALFFTHIYRFPMAIAAVVGVALLMGPRGGRARSFGLPLVPPIALCAAWLAMRPSALKPKTWPLGVHLERLTEVERLTGAFHGPWERYGLLAAGGALGAFLVLRLVVFVMTRRGALAAEPPGPPRAFRRRATLIAMGALGGTLLLYLTLPMQLGMWWYVYPREATTLVFLSFALLPDLPRARGPRAALTALALAAPLPTAYAVARNYGTFTAEVRDFRAITAALPPAPRLLYLIFDHGGSTRRVTPFLHLPAWVQAEKGGWLSYHFATYGAAPIKYRPREGRERVVPPPTPVSWEWRPDKFDVLSHGGFFDWFLVRRGESPADVFEADPELVEVGHVGRWWLFRRTPAAHRKAASGAP